jgi:hypothetical protein
MVHYVDLPTTCLQITKDIEVVRVVLLLTGSLQSLRQRAAAYLATFEVIGSILVVAASLNNDYLAAV